jgi:hypothetical protein
MNRVAFCVLSVAAFGVSVARGLGVSSAEGSGATGKPAVTLRIVPRVGYGGTIYAIVGVRNGTDGPLWLNTRLVWQGPDPVMPGDNTRNLWFEIKYRNDRQVSYRCAAPNGPRAFKNTDYRVLKPGEGVDEDVDLSCFDLSRLGEYTVVAHYFDRQKSPPRPPAATTSLNYELVSAPVVFSVMGGS